MVSAISKLQYEINFIFSFNVIFVFMAARCPPPPPEYKKKDLLLTNNVDNIIATYACPHGKGPRQQTMHCGEDGQWIEDLEPCKGVKDIMIHFYYNVLFTVLFCSNVTVPLPPLTLSIEDNDNVIGSKRNYSCNDSCYELIGTANQTCNYSSDGRHAVWSSEVPTCESKFCHLTCLNY